MHSGRGSEGWRGRHWGPALSQGAPRQDDWLRSGLAAGTRAYEALDLLHLRPQRQRRLRPYSGGLLRGVRRDRGAGLQGVGARLEPSHRLDGHALRQSILARFGWGILVPGLPMCQEPLHLHVEHPRQPETGATEDSLRAVGVLRGLLHHCTEGGRGCLRSGAPVRRQGRQRRPRGEGGEHGGSPRACRCGRSGGRGEWQRG
mmetsp:Transcript_6225/g.16642  ORF Transcript_6225/g.16642 Transcript_6225/m.16642 type:complete len:202 (+) Transcript_6225:749-1354(+)